MYSLIGWQYPCAFNISKTLFPNEVDVNLPNGNIRYQQDGVPPQYAIPVWRYLDNTFLNRLIESHAAIEWLLQLPDLRVFRFFSEFIRIQLQLNSTQVKTKLKSKSNWSSDVIQEAFNSNDLSEIVLCYSLSLCNMKQK